MRAPWIWRAPCGEAYVIEGLDNVPNVPAGSFAIYTKLHHSLVDGAGGNSVLAMTHDPEPNPPPIPAVEDPGLADMQPSMPQLLSKASVNGVKNSLSLLRGTFDNARSMGGYALGLARGKIPLPEITAPRTRFNQPVSPHRVFDAAEFPLEGFKRIKNAAGVKLNDVALAVIAGAMRRYLDARDETPEGSLTATLPLNMRTRRASSEDHNQVGSVFTSLHHGRTRPRKAPAGDRRFHPERQDLGRRYPAGRRDQARRRGIPVHCPPGRPACGRDITSPSTCRQTCPR